MNVGIHFSNKVWESPGPREFDLLRLARPDCIKTCLHSQCGFNQVDVHRQLREDHPNALIVARLTAPMQGGHWDVEGFVSAFGRHIESLSPYVQWFEVHNEPNHDRSVEGFGATPEAYQEFAAWVERVLARLKANHPWARWVFPGNLVKPFDPGNHINFWQMLLPTIRQFDAWGVHAYWQIENHSDPGWGRTYEIAHDLLPDMPLVVTEFGDSTVGRSPAEKIGRYLEWYRQADTKPYIMGTALYLMGGTPDWISQPGMANFDVTEEMARAIGDLPRAARRALPREAEWPLDTDGFDFPVARPDGLGYYVAAGLAERAYYERFGSWHTGEDWNRNLAPGGNGDIDLGDPVFAIAHGRVVTSQSYPTWGNIVLIEHRQPGGQTVWSQYAHLLESLVKRDDIVRRGQQIGTIGKGAEDQFPAHLHFEIRQKELPASKWGWKTPADRSRLLQSYCHATAFIASHRPGRQTVIVTPDDEGSGFSRSPAPFWCESTQGYSGRCWWTWTVGQEQTEACVATWQPGLPRGGQYEVFVYIPGRDANSRQAAYQIVHRRGTDTVAIDQSDHYDEWVSLGSYPFSEMQPASVRLSDLTGEPFRRDRAACKKIAFDAVMWALVEGQA